MAFSWTLLVDLGIVSLGLLLATFIRAKVSFFQRYLIPNALTAGFILLLFYNLAAPPLGLGSEDLGNLVFHLLNLSFVAMSLKGGSMKGSGRRIFATAVTVVSQYTIQVIIGLGLTALLMATVMPKLFLNFGFLLALGFGLGPGQSFAIGKSWEPAGFASAGNLGLVFAAVGYLWGCIRGVWLINLGLRRKWIDGYTERVIGQKGLRTGIFGREERFPVGALLKTDTEAVDSMSYNLAIVFGVYLLAFLALKLITWPLASLGPMGQQLSDTLWGITFIFGALLGMLARKIMGGLAIEHTLDEGMLNRIVGGTVDLMVTAAVAAITIVTVTEYWLPIVAICIVGGVVTTITVLWTTSRLFDNHQFGRALMMYGNMTGTLSTGIALTRVVDPQFETPVASDFMFASGVTFVLVLPMILLINLPIYWYRTGSAIYLWLTIGGFALYAAFSIVAYAALAGRKAWARFGQLWYRGT